MGVIMFFSTITLLAVRALSDKNAPQEFLENASYLGKAAVKNFNNAGELLSSKVPDAMGSFTAMVTGNVKSNDIGSRGLC